MVASLPESVSDRGNLGIGVGVALRTTCVDNVPLGSLETQSNVFREAVVNSSVDRDLRDWERKVQRWLSRSVGGSFSPCCSRR